jgi:hypothetical protein
MSNYIKLDTGEVKTQGEWRQANKHISLPRVWTATTLTDLGLTAVLAAPKPDCTDLEQVIGNGVTTDANGNTVEAWSVVDKFSDTTDEDGVVTTKAEHEAEYQARLDAEAAESVRTQRDKLLAESDWMVIRSAETGVALDSNWATYRQALRDITDHVNFPYLTDEDWPVAP